MASQLNVGTITDTTVNLILTLDDTYASDTTVTFFAAISVDSRVSDTATIPAGSEPGDTIEKTLTGLTPSTAYSAGANIDGYIPTIPGGSFTTKAAGYNNPRSATQEQWEDLASRVRSKAEIGTVVSTPSNVAYVGTNNIVDSAVTASKIDTETLPGKTASPVTVTDTKTIGSTWTDYGTYTVPATGLYMSRIAINSDAISTNHNSQGRLLNGDTEIQWIQEWPCEAWSGNYFCRGSNTWVFWFEQGDVLTLQGKNNNATVGLTVTLSLQQIY